MPGRALAILHDARRRSDGPDLVFRRPCGKPLSDMTLSKLIKELGIAPCRMGSGRASGTGRQSRRIRLVRRSRRH